MLNAINGFNALKDILDGIIHRILASLQRQPLMAHILQRNDLPAYLLLRQLFAGNMLIFQVIRTIDASVDTVIRKIERRKHDDPVSVEVFFNLPCQFVDFGGLLRNFTGQKDGCLPVIQSLFKLRLTDYFVYQLFVIFVGLCIGQGFHDFFMADKLPCFV